MFIRLLYARRYVVSEKWNKTGNILVINNLVFNHTSTGGNGFRVNKFWY